MPGCRAWNAETAITGGLVSDNLLTIMWNKIAALTGGSSEWPIGLGLRPWYLKVIVIQAQPETDRIVAKAGSLRASLSAGRLGC